MSVLRSRLSSYRKACKLDPAGALSERPDRKTEATMLKQLRVTFTELRKFILSIDPFHLDVDDSIDTAGEGDAYLIESSFGLTRPLDLTIKDHVAVDLKDLAPVKKIRDATIPDNFNDTGRRGDALELQAIRLRYRITRKSERRTTILRLGTSVKPFQQEAPDAPDLPEVEQMARRLAGIPLVESGVTAAAEAALTALPVSLGLSAEWVNRVGMEGIVDIHTWLAEGEIASGTVRSSGPITDHLYRTEVIVPGVTLFSQ